DVGGRVPREMIQEFENYAQFIKNGDEKNREAALEFVHKELFLIGAEDPIRLTEKLKQISSDQRSQLRRFCIHQLKKLGDFAFTVQSNQLILYQDTNHHSKHHSHEDQITQLRRALARSKREQDSLIWELKEKEKESKEFGSRSLFKFGSSQGKEIQKLEEK